MRNNKHIIQSLWIGPELSAIEQLAIKSFLQNGHEFHLYIYEEPKNIPAGTQLKSADAIISKKEIFTYNNGSYAGFADWFRWELLYQKGNYWVDMDMICIKPFNFEEDIVFGIESENYAACGVLKFPKGHELGKSLALVCKNPNRLLVYDSVRIKLKKVVRWFLKGNKKSNIGWGEAGGPLGFTRALQHYNLFNKSKPISYFYPISFRDWFKIYKANFDYESVLSSETYAIHLSNEMTRRQKNFDKNAVFHESSLIEKLKKDYNV